MSEIKASDFTGWCEANQEAWGSLHGTLDLRGALCPLPVLKIRKAIASLSSGERLCAYVSDPAAQIDIPHYCHESGNRLVRQVSFDAEVRVFILEKA